MTTAPTVLRVTPSPQVRSWADRHGFTPELVARWVSFLPEPQRVLESLLRPVPRYLRVNTRRADPEALVGALTARGFVLSPVDGPGGRFPVLRIDKEPHAISATPEHLSGELYLQDPASLLAVAALEPRPGERILDMAAAPGGKTSAIAELVDDDASILAVEPVPERAAALTANLRRLGVAGAAVVVAPGESIPLQRPFDRILLDAPCTGEGVLPRDPARRSGRLEEYGLLSALQRTLIDHAIRLLAPGGVLVYSTCTFAPEENEAAVAYAVDRGLEPEPLPVRSLNGVALSPPLAAAGAMKFDARVQEARRVYPHRHGTLGFFVARLRKPAAGAVGAAAAVAAPRAVSAGVGS